MLEILNYIQESDKKSVMHMAVEHSNNLTVDIILSALTKT